MERRAFLRSGLAATILAPSTLSLPDLALGTPTLRRQAKGPIKLSSNENALGLPEGARRAIIDALAVGNRYTGSTAGITERLARKHGVPAGTILLGNGSTEVLQMTAQAVAAGRGDARLVVADPTYEAVPRDAAAMGAEV
ncbi:MAG: aminotransferase class I/II-fold pyridoxal phosphate-dependent enzyme, partial [Gemmatimonadetes bacterium]|nr:aminotransferase class I/II-fold pyridoxal phosphate-dependent enzyme [Gemmatimonadota bacterium]